MVFYRIVRAIASLVVRLLTRFRVRGLANIPARGPCIIAANHFHALDPLMLAIAVRRPTCFMAKEEILRWPIFGWLVRRVGVFPVKRGKVDVQAFRRSLEILGRDGALGIFPEGTRSKTGEMQEALNGAALLSARTGSPIVPVALAGHYRLGGVVKVKIGPPIYIACATAGKPTPEERVAGTKLLTEHIAELLTQCKDESW